MADTDKNAGLNKKYIVEKVGGDRPGSRYFVLDYVHDPASRYALAEYAFAAYSFGFEQLALDLKRELEETAAEFEEWQNNLNESSDDD